MKRKEMDMSIFGSGNPGADRIGCKDDIQYLLRSFPRVRTIFLFTLKGMLRNYPLTLLMLIGDFMLVRSLVQYFSYGRSFLARTLGAGRVLFIAFVAAILMQLTSSSIWWGYPQPTALFPFSWLFSSISWLQW